MSELCVLARVGDRLVAVPAIEVGSVIDLGPLLSVPLAQSPAIGLAAVRSQVLTVVDVSLALGGPPIAEDRRRALVVTHAGHRYALLFDTVLEVAGVSDVASGKSVRLGERWSRATTGTVATPQGYALSLSIAALVEPDTEWLAA